LRSAGETGWLLEQLGPGEEFSRYEFRSEILVASTPSLTALCCYDMRALHPTAVGLAQALHPARLGPAGDDVGFTLTCSGDGVAAISGEIDCAFADQVGSLIEDSAGQITTLDLSQLRFADITGLRALSGAAERIRWTHGDVRIQGASPSFRRLWKILGLDDRVRGSFDDS
jgi:anti-anti-sigma factor